MPIEPNILEYVSHNPDDEELDLSSYELNETDYQQLAQALAQNTHLKRILWKQVPSMDSRAGDRIYQSLKRNKEPKLAGEAAREPHVIGPVNISAQVEPDAALKEQLIDQNASGNDNTLATHGDDSHYWYSIQDVQVLVQAIRQAKLIYNKEDTSSYRCKPEEEYSATRENRACILLTDPFYVENFATAFEDDIKTITGQHTVDSEGSSLQAKNNPWQHMPRLIIIPLLSGSHWHAIRVEVDYQNLQMSILWDDPYGQGHFPVTLKQQCLVVLKQAANRLIQVQINHPSFTLNSSTIVEYEKSCNQQGWQIGLDMDKNDWDCGPIVVSNCQDYCNSTRSNQAFATEAESYTLCPKSALVATEQIANLRRQHCQLFREISHSLFMNQEQQKTHKPTTTNLLRGFFNHFSLASNYEVNQPFINQTIHLLNELAETSFKGYLRKGDEPFIVDAVLEGSKELLNAKQQVLLKYAITSNIQCMQNRVYLIVRDNNSTEQAEKIAAAYHSPEAILDRVCKQCFMPG